MQHHMMRRLIPRQPADCRATYLIEGEDHEGRRDCRRHPIVAANPRTQVKNARHRNAAWLRVATQFLNPTARERASVDSLTDIGAPW